MNGKSATQVRVNLNDLKEFRCECGCNVFDDVCRYRVVPALYSQTGQPMLLKIPCSICTSCSKVLTQEEILKLATVGGIIK